MQKKLVISRDLVMVLALVSLLPIWRSGLRGNLNFWVWLKEHTVWGSPVQYVPEENYEV